MPRRRCAAAAWQRSRHGRARPRFPARRYILRARQCPRGSDPGASPAAAAAADPPHPSRPPSLGRSRPLYGIAKARVSAGHTGNLPMPAPLMPKATAVWLVENTSLTFDQIADFCGLHPLEVQAIADGEVAIQMQGLDPVANGQTTAEEIERAQADPDARLKLSDQAVPQQFVNHKGPRYPPISNRQNKPDAIMSLLRNLPELADGQIANLTGTTKPAIAAIPDRTHQNNDIKPRHPVSL